MGVTSDERCPVDAGPVQPTLRIYVEEKDRESVHPETGFTHALALACYTPAPADRAPPLSDGMSNYPHINPGRIGEVRRIMQDSCLPAGFKRNSPTRDQHPAATKS